jgi:hypothetical protein
MTSGTPEDTVLEAPERRNGHRDTSAANYARQLKKRRRWAEELRATGWTVIEPVDTTPEK